MPRHTPGHTAEPKGHFWKKKNKKKPCCSVRREEEQEAAGPFPHGSVLYSNFPAATRRRTSRSESHPLSPSLQCTLFSVQGLSISHLVLRVLNDKTYRKSWESLRFSWCCWWWSQCTPGSPSPGESPAAPDPLVPPWRPPAGLRARGRPPVRSGVLVLDRVRNHITQDEYFPDLRCFYIQLNILNSGLGT